MSSYIKTIWANKVAPYINAINLNKIEEGIFNNSSAIQTLSAGENAKGVFTPAAGTEYPSTPTINDSWYISGLSPTGYTYAAGDLSGETSNNQDKILFTASGWVLIDSGVTEVADTTVKVKDDAEFNAMTTSPDTIWFKDGRYGSNVLEKTDEVLTDNGGTVRVNGSGAVYKLQYDGAVNVKWFGVKGDGSDDTVAIQKAFDINSDIIYIPAGEYKVSPTLDTAYVQAVLSPASNTTINMIGVTFRLFNSPSNSLCISFIDKENITINGGTIIGETGKNTGFGYFLTGCRNITLNNVTANNFTSDGIYLGYTSSANTGDNAFPNATIINGSVFNNNTRQGMSIIGAVGLEVNLSTFSHNSGSPGAGIDIEPNNATCPFKNMIFNNIITENNELGFEFYLSQLDSTSSEVSIIVNNYTDKGSKKGLYLAHVPKSTKGVIEINNMILNPGLAADTERIHFRAYNADGIRAILNNPIVYYYGATQHDAAIGIYIGNSPGSTLPAGSELEHGGITINEPSIISLDGLSSFDYGAITFASATGGAGGDATWKDVFINDPVRIDSSTSTGSNRVNKIRLANYGGNPSYLVFNDKYNVLVQEAPVSILTGYYSVSKIKNTTGVGVILSADFPTQIGNRLTVEISAANGYITPPSDVVIRGSFGVTTDGQSIETAGENSSIILETVAHKVLRIVSQTTEFTIK